MKRIVYFLVCFFIITSDISALSLENKEENRVIDLKSTNLEYSLGDVLQNKITKKIIRIRNKLNEALKIKEVRTTCDCVQVDVESKTVEKDGIFEVEITFDSTSISGDVEEIVYILTDNMNYGLMRLVISATIVK